MKKRAYLRLVPQVQEEEHFGRFARAFQNRCGSPWLKFAPILPIDSGMSQNCAEKVTLGDLRPQGLLDLYRQGTTWVAAIRLRDGRLTNFPLEESVTTRKAALQFLKIELSRLEPSRLQIRLRLLPRTKSPKGRLP